MPWSRKSRAIPLTPLWAVGPVQSLSACTRVHFNLTYISTPPMGRTACTEPQCLYKGAIYLTYRASCVYFYCNQKALYIYVFEQLYIFMYLFQHCLHYSLPQHTGNINTGLSRLYIRPLNHLNAEITPMCHLLTLLVAHHILHVNWVRVKHNNDTNYTVMSQKIYFITNKNINVLTG